MAHSAFARAVLRALSYRRRLSALALMCSLTAVPCAAGEIVVKNDSMPPVGDPLPEAPQGMRIGIWLDAPVDGTIVGVQVVWGSESGDAAPTQQVALRISPYDPLTSMSGTPWATIDSPVLLDSGTNEFRYLDPGTNLLPLAVPVSAGDRFLVDLEFNNQQPGDPSILMDTDGEISMERNLIKFLSSGWGYLALGVVSPGDLGIRAIIQPVPEPSSMILLNLGMIGIVVTARRRLRRTQPT